MSERTSVRAVGRMTSRIAAFAGASLVAGRASAQASQQLVLAFDGGLSIPISGYTTLGIALAVAAIGWGMLRSGRVTRFWAVLLAVAGGALLLALPERDAVAIVPGLTVNLTTSPAIVSIPPPGPTTLQVTATNGVGHNITIASLSLSSGPYTIQSVMLLPTAAGISACAPGLVLAAGASCFVTLGTSAG